MESRCVFEDVVRVCSSGSYASLWSRVEELRRLASLLRELAYGFKVRRSQLVTVPLYRVTEDGRLESVGRVTAMVVCLSAPLLGEKPEVYTEGGLVKFVYKPSPGREDEAVRELCGDSPFLIVYEPSTPLLLGVKGLEGKLLELASGIERVAERLEEGLRLWNRVCAAYSRDPLGFHLLAETRCDLSKLPDVVAERCLGSSSIFEFRDCVWNLVNHAFDALESYIEVVGGQKPPFYMRVLAAADAIIRYGDRFGALGWIMSALTAWAKPFLPVGTSIIEAASGDWGKAAAELQDYLSRLWSALGSAAAFTVSALARGDFGALASAVQSLVSDLLSEENLKALAIDAILAVLTGGASLAARRLAASGAREAGGEAVESLLRRVVSTAASLVARGIATLGEAAVHADFYVPLKSLVARVLSAGGVKEPVARALSSIVAGAASTPLEVIFGFGGPLSRAAEVLARIPVAGAKGIVRLVRVAGDKFALVVPRGLAREARLLVAAEQSVERLLSKLEAGGVTAREAAEALERVRELAASASTEEGVREAAELLTKLVERLARVRGGIPTEIVDKVVSVYRVVAERGASTEELRRSISKLLDETIASSLNDVLESLEQELTRNAVVASPREAVDALRGVLKELSMLRDELRRLEERASASEAARLVLEKSRGRVAEVLERVAELLERVGSKLESLPEGEATKVRKLLEEYRGVASDLSILTGVRLDRVVDKLLSKLGSVGSTRVEELKARVVESSRVERLKGLLERHIELLEEELSRLRAGRVDTGRLAELLSKIAGDIRELKEAGAVSEAKGLLERLAELLRSNRELLEGIASELPEDAEKLLRSMLGATSESTELVTELLVKSVEEATGGERTIGRLVVEALEAEGGGGHRRRLRTVIYVPKVVVKKTVPSRSLHRVLAERAVGGEEVAGIQRVGAGAELVTVEEGGTGARTSEGGWVGTGVRERPTGKEAAERPAPPTPPGGAGTEGGGVGTPPRPLRVWEPLRSIVGRFETVLARPELVAAAAAGLATAGALAGKRGVSRVVKPVVKPLVEAASKAVKPELKRLVEVAKQALTGASSGTPGSTPPSPAAPVSRLGGGGYTGESRTRVYKEAWSLF